MANDLTQNPMRVDTAAATVLLTNRLSIKTVRWVEATTAGHLAEIQDQNSNVKWRSVASGPNNVESELIEGTDMWDGLKVPTLGSGVLWITYA